MLLGTAYFPPIEYFAAIAAEFSLSPEAKVPAQVWIEAQETYRKQSYRNRCKFYAASGLQTLSFPVVHEGGSHSLPISEIRIDWSVPWLQRTERAIASAYESSAYFDYYKDELFALLEKRPEKLFDFNLSIIRFFLDKTGIEADLRMTQQWTPPGSGIYGRDLREVIHPKRENGILEELGLKKPYFQVFARKHGFIANLSIMDLLFNEGPDSILWLKKL
ncbi:MAG: WbqC family protein [Bacteroidia bacterium]|nr:WbqC family protein [Bacteroidia bacterium]